MRLADQDGTIVATYYGDPERNSLESLATKGKKHGAVSFVATREYLRKLKADYAGTPLPSGDYFSIYLTKEELRFVRRKYGKLPEALPGESRAYLRSIGLDPDSEEVHSAELAGTVEATNGGVPASLSLHSLIREKKRDAVIGFVKSRGYINALESGFDETPPLEDYDPSFLTVKERTLAEKKAAAKEGATPAPAPVLHASAPPSMAAATAKYLSSIGIDPGSMEVVAVHEEGPVSTIVNEDPEEYSLDRLAAEKRKNGLRVFVHMRTFIRALKKDFAGTSIPKKDYDPFYLTREERALVGRKFVEGMFKKKG